MRLLLLVIAFSLVACGGEATDNKKQEPSSSTETKKTEANSLPPQLDLLAEAQTASGLSFTRFNDESALFNLPIPKDWKQDYKDKSRYLNVSQELLPGKLLDGELKVVSRYSTMEYDAKKSDMALKRPDLKSEAKEFLRQSERLDGFKLNGTSALQVDGRPGRFFSYTFTDKNGQNLITKAAITCNNVASYKILYTANTNHYSRQDSVVFNTALTGFRFDIPADLKSK